MEEQPNWAAVAAALDTGDLDLAARRLLTGGFVPSIRRQLQAKFDKTPTTYVDDAVSEAGCEEYCEREVDEVEWQGGRVYLHLGARRDDPPRG
jgi:hypothetical protein